MPLSGRTTTPAPAPQQPSTEEATIFEPCQKPPGSRSRLVPQRRAGEQKSLEPTNKALKRPAASDDYSAASLQKKAKPDEKAAAELLTVPESRPVSRAPRRDISPITWSPDRSTRAVPTSKQRLNKPCPRPTRIRPILWSQERKGMTSGPSSEADKGKVISSTFQGKSTAPPAKLQNRVRIANSSPDPKRLSQGPQQPSPVPRSGWQKGSQQMSSATDRGSAGPSLLQSSLTAWLRGQALHPAPLHWHGDELLPSSAVPAVVVHATNVGLSRGGSLFDCEAVLTLVRALQAHNPVQQLRVVVPKYRSTTRWRASRSPLVLKELEREGLVRFTEWKNVGTKRTDRLDADYVIDYSFALRAILVSNEDFGGLSDEHSAFLATRQLRYTWSARNKEVLFALRPLGPQGPLLVDFLKTPFREAKKDAERAEEEELKPKLEPDSSSSSEDEDQDPFADFKAYYQELKLEKTDVKKEAAENESSAQQ